MIDLNKEFTNEFVTELFEKRIAVAKHINKDVDEIVLAHMLKSTADKLESRLKGDPVKVQITKKTMLDFLTGIIPVIQAGDLLGLIENLNETLDMLKQFPIVQQLLKEKYPDEVKE